MTPADLITKYIRLRNKVAELKTKHATELAPYAEVMNKIEIELLDHLNQTKLDSINGPGGTAFKSTVTSVTVDNWSATLDHIRKHELWDLLEARVAKNATLTAMEDTKQPVPGVKVSQATVLRVRVS